MKKISLIIIVLIAIAVPVNAVLVTNVVSIGIQTIEAGGTLRVPVYLNNSSDIEAVGIKLTFDPAVVNISSLDPVYPENASGFVPLYSTEDVGNFTLFYGPDNRFASSGVITINTFKNGTGLSGDQIIGYVRMNAVGSAGSSSSLNISVLAMGDGNANDVGTYGVENGSVSITATPAKGTINGLMTNSYNGDIIPGVTITLANSGGIVATTTTNSTGFYSFSNVEAGDYFVNTSMPTFFSKPTSLTLGAGENREVNMALWLIGDLNNDGEVAGIVDVNMMIQGFVGDIPVDWTFDLNNNGDFADIVDFNMIIQAFVGDIKL